MERAAEDRGGAALLRGEPLDAVSRDSQIPAHQLERWKRVFLENGPRVLKTRAEPEERELTLARAKIGELLIRLELPEHLIEKRGLATSGRDPGDEGGEQSEYEPVLSAHDDLSRVACGALERLRDGLAPGAASMLGKRGPKTLVSDPDLVAAIRRVLSETPFHGEGHRKVRARPTHRGVAVGGKRVLRLMRQHQLLAPRRLAPPNWDPAHAGTIITTRPNAMWGTDAPRFYTEHDGWCCFFGAIDHSSDDLVGWHVAKLGDRWAAPEPIRQGVRHAVGAFGKDVARGLLTEARAIIARYNAEWLIERLGHRTPAAARAAARAA